MPKKVPTTINDLETLAEQVAQIVGDHGAYVVPWLEGHPPATSRLVLQRAFASVVIADSSSNDHSFQFFVDSRMI